VNAANEECLGGGGVDGAITEAGGPRLAKDRLVLPIVSAGIRCPTGGVVITGPNRYGTLRIDQIIGTLKGKSLLKSMIFLELLKHV